MSKAYRRAGSTSDRSTSQLPGQPLSTVQPQTPEQRQAIKAVWYDDLVRQIRVLATRGDGWMRVIPDTDRQQVWLKWKFTSGQHQHKYIMICVGDMELHRGFHILVSKLYDVDEGLLKPTMDKLYEEG